MWKWLGIGVATITALLAGVAWYYLSPNFPDAPQLSGSLISGTSQHDNLERTWQAYLPSTGTNGKPLVIVLHGSRGDSQAARVSTFYSFEHLSERHGFVVVYPAGFDRHWNDCRASADYAANLQDIDDVGFLQQLVQELVEQYKIDQARVYVTGISNGGHMAYKVALEAPELIAAAAPVIANLPVSDNLDCEPSNQPVPMMILNGSEDPINPHDGGLVSLMGNDSRGTVLSSEATARYWADLAGYKSEGVQAVLPDEVDDATHLETLTWSAPGKVGVQLVTMVGAGHTFPHSTYSMPVVLGRTSHEVDGAELVWSFFESNNGHP